jgi:Ca2+-binding EF-hand superfamily protein
MTTRLSPEQTEEFKQAFKMMDIDGDGLITPWVFFHIYRNSRKS